MVDDPTPINADGIADATSAVSTLIDALKAAGVSSDTISQIVQKVIGTFSKMSGAGKEAAGSLSDFDRISQLTGASMGELGANADGAANFLDRFKNMSLASANAFNMVGVALMGPSQLLKQIGADKSMTSLSASIAQVVTDSRGLAGPMGAMVDMLGINLTKVVGGQIIKKGFDEIKREVINLGAAIDQHINMERAVFNMTAQTGQMNTMFGSTSVSLSDLSNVSKNYEDKLNNIATATHSDREATGAYFEALNKLPPIYGQNVDGATRMKDQMVALSTNITLAHGSGQQFNDVLSQQKTLMETFNVTAANSNNITAEGAQLTQKFGVNIADTTRFLTSMADTFQFLGDNTEGVTNIFNEFFGGLREGGLGIKPAIETVKQMGESLVHLNIAQKAFISGRTGGPGGLLGGIQIEKDLAAGNTKGVMDKLRQSFMQSLPGGKVITRDEVTTQAQASQYEAQVRKLHSGAFGNIAKTDEQAAAILKAFSSNKPADLKSANDALKDVMKTGTDYQKLSYTRVDHIAATLDGMAMHGGTTAADVVQGKLTLGGAEGPELTALEGITNEAGRRVERVEQPGDKAKQYSNETITDGIKDINEFLPVTMAELGKGIKNATTSPTSGPKSSSDAFAIKATAQIEAQRADLQRMLKSGTLSQQDYSKQMGAIDTYEKLHPLSPNQTKGKLVGEAVQHAAAGTHPAGQQQRPQPSTIRTAATSGPETLAATINVYIDGKKIQQSSQAAALGPQKDMGAGH
jgi:hypothetical protein